MERKQERGVTVITLTVMVIIMLTITGTIMYSTKSSTKVKKIQNLKNDIDSIESRVNMYYLNYGELPILVEYANKEDLKQKLEDNMNNMGAGAQFQDKLLYEEDDDTYYIINLEKLENLSLYYGYDEQYKAVKAGESIEGKDEFYIINQKSHKIYFPHGIKIDGVMYYTK